MKSAKKLLLLIMVVFSFVIPVNAKEDLKNNGVFEYSYGQNGFTINSKDEKDNQNLQENHKFEISELPYFSLEFTEDIKILKHELNIMDYEGKIYYGGNVSFIVKIKDGYDSVVKVNNVEINSDADNKYTIKMDGDKRITVEYKKIPADTYSNKINQAKFITEVQEEFLKLINNEREQKGLERLVYGEHLKFGTELRASELADFGIIDTGKNKDKIHARPDGENLYRTAYYYLDNYYVKDSEHIGENLLSSSFPSESSKYLYQDFKDSKIFRIEANLASPNDFANFLFTKWKQSPSHYQNMLYENYKSMWLSFKIGIDSERKGYDILVAVTTFDLNENEIKTEEQINPIKFITVDNLTSISSSDSGKILVIKNKNNEFVDALKLKIEDKSTKYYFYLDKDYYEKSVGNGIETIKIDVKPTSLNGRTLMPIRFVAELIGVDVNWEQKTKTATFIKGDLKATIVLGQKIIKISDGRIVTMDVEPKVIQERIMIPLTNLSQIFGLTNGNLNDNIDNDIEWDQNNYRVIIKAYK